MVSLGCRNNNYKVFEAGAKNLGYKQVHTGGWRLTVSHVMEGLIANKQVSVSKVVSSAPKWSSAYSDIPKGEATGNLEVSTNAQVLKIEHDAKSGKVTGVIYADKDGNQQMQKARIVAVAGNSIDRVLVCY